MHRTFVFRLSLMALLLGGVLLASNTSLAQTTKTYNNIDDITAQDNGTVGWGMCSNCAGGQNIADVFWMAQNQTTPSRDGASTELYMSSTNPYSNVLYYNKLGPLNTATHFAWDFWFLVDSTSSGAQTYEFDTFQFVNGRRYMFGTQCNYSNGQWQIWSEGGGMWLNTGFTCQKFSPGKWYHITWNFHRGTGTNTKMYYDNFTVQQAGGFATTRYLSVSEPSGPLPAGWGSNLGVQFQLDLAGSPGEMQAWIDKVKLSVY